MIKYLKLKLSYHSIVSLVHPLLIKHVQHCVMEGREEDRSLDLIIKEHAVVQFLQDVYCDQK